MLWFTNVAFEIPGLQLGLYTYYGPQAFEVFGFPLWMGLANALMPITIGASIYVLGDFLSRKSWHVWLAIPIVSASGLAGGAVVGWPMWFALNSGYGVAGTQIATGVVLAFAVLIVYIMTTMLCRDQSSAATA